MNMTIEKNTINTFEEKLREDIQHLHRQLGYARRTPKKMSAFYGFCFIETNHVDSQSVEITFDYKGTVLLHVLLHNKEVSFYKFGLEDYVLSQKETIQLFDALLPEFKHLASLL